MKSQDKNSRVLVVQLVFIVVALLFTYKIMDLQLFDKSFGEKAQAAALNKYTIYPSRGLIYDRNGNLLTYNNPVYDLMVTYNQIDKDMDIAKFCKILGITKKVFKDKLNKNWKDVRFSKRKPYVFLSKISQEAYAQLQESFYEFPGFFAQVRNVRGYPYPNAAHLLGFIREVNKKEVEDSSEIYFPGDYIGASGLELQYENELRGKKGAKFILKDYLGKPIGSYKDGKIDIKPVQGKDLITTIDIDLQAYAEKLLQNKKGSIVAIEPATGEVLVFSSSPSYDPNLLTMNKNRGRDYANLLNDENKPLFNRAVSAKYPPGSIIKPVIALIGMEEGVLGASQYIYCDGAYHYNEHRWGCHQHPAVIGVPKAIQYSCNTYFFQTFRNIIDQFGFYEAARGLNNFNNYLHDFGLGKPLGLDFPLEKKGNIPTPEFYDKLYPKEKGGWKSPTIISLGIGQGELELTTLQMANLAAEIANQGYYITPHLVKGMKGAEFNTEFKKKNLSISKEYYLPVFDGMERVVSMGTGTSAYIRDIPICGKTGTAQNPHGKDHSIFFAFAPKDNPKIAIAVYVENGGAGYTFAAPISSLIIEKYLTGKIHPNRFYREKRILDADLISTP